MKWLLPLIACLTLSACIVNVDRKKTEWEKEWEESLAEIQEKYRNNPNVTPDTGSTNTPTKTVVKTVQVCPPMTMPALLPDPPTPAAAIKAAGSDQRAIDAALLNHIRSLKNVNATNRQRIQAAVNAQRARCSK